MKKNDLPAWAKKYDGKGIAFRKRGDSFALFRVSSHREQGKKYPVLDQAYLGTVSERDGFSPSYEKAKTNGVLLECGLSHFIMANFHRELLRSVFNSSPDLADNKIAAAIVLFLYGAITPRTIRLSCVAHGREDTVLRLGSSSLPSLENLRKRIENLFTEKFGDESDRNDLICILRQEMADPRSPEFSGYTEEARKIMEKYGGDFR